jgi:hypothetical protein
MYQIITWGSYDEYRIVNLVKTNKDLIQLNIEFHNKYNIPWGDNYIHGDFDDKKQRKKIRSDLRKDGFDININHNNESEFVNAFIQWLKYEHQVEVLLYKEIRFDEDPKHSNY